MELNRAYGAAAAMGLVAGLRSFTAPAAVSRASASGVLRLEDSGLRWLGSPVTAGVLLALAAGELVADKLPFIPNRTDPGPLVARIASGGLCGAAICTAERQSVAAGAILGGLAAVVSAYTGYSVRKHAVQTHHTPDLECAIVEDALAVGGAMAILGGLKGGL